MTKAKRSKAAVDLTSTKVFVKLGADVQSAFNHRSGADQIITFPAVVATVANMVKSGKLTGSEEDDRYVVTLNDVDQLAAIFEMVREYQAGRPATVVDAKNAMAFSEQAIEFARSNNNGLDLSQAERKLAGAKSQMKAMVFASGSEEKSAVSDFRPVVEAAYNAANIAKQAVVDHLLARASELAKETDTLDELREVAKSLPADLDSARKALVAFIKKAHMLRVDIRPTNTGNKPNRDDHLSERIGTSLGRIGGHKRTR